MGIFDSLGLSGGAGDQSLSLSAIKPDRPQVLEKNAINAKRRRVH
jgi:hypothetical protein